MSRLRRLMNEERLVQLAADAIQRRHPHAGWLARTIQMPIPLPDAKVEEAIEKLTAWLEEHPELPTGQE